jgi:uncharacterized membrane protein
MRRKHPDLLAILIITLVTLILSLSGLRAGNIEYETMPLWMAPFGILLVLFIPGYAIISAILPKVGSEKTLLLSLGVSISLSAVGGLILNLTPWGLTVITQSLWLSSISIIGIIFAWHRRKTLDHNFEMGVPSLRKNNLIIFGVAGLFLLVSVLMAYTSSKQAETTFTQLWAIPGVSEEGNYQIQIGIRNEEKQSETYNLYIEVDGRNLDEWAAIPLQSGNEWTTVYQLSGKPSRPIRISLYRISDIQNVYRWLRISPEEFK